jgi:hypothetical protein
MASYELKGSALKEATTRDHAARILSVSPGRISQMMSDGQLGYVVVGRRRFPHVESVYGCLSLRNFVRSGKEDE